ncbi:MAG: acyl-CoA dehydrogenase family protein [Paracoccaceae bacterium]
MNIQNIDQTNIMNHENNIFLCENSLKNAEIYLSKLIMVFNAELERDSRLLSKFLDEEQIRAHGVAWIGTYVEALRQLLGWAKNLRENSTLHELENLILIISYAEYMSQIKGGIMMSQNEIIRPSDFGIDPTGIFNEEDEKLIALGTSKYSKNRLIELILQNSGSTTYGHSGLSEEYELIREQFKKFSDNSIKTIAHDWHLNDQLIPETLIKSIADLGVFGLTIPEKYGGLEMDKTSMCVVSEELSRGYIGVGSLATRTEIAAELILGSGTEEQKLKWLPKLASGEILPTAVFTEPNTGSDLGALQTRAELNGNTYQITGNKTWITHGARSDLMTLLARTKPEKNDYSGLSMFLAEKKRGVDNNPFPTQGMKGSEIEVLGYRGMKEYEIAFDKFSIDKEGLLGGRENLGFKQLMQTFESARIQTAARAIGVAQNALDLSISYASERKQFGKKLIEFPRVFNKICLVICEIALCRQLTYFAAQRKDEGRRCDLEAGMAKLMAARVAWSAADNGVQIHGGNGFALEYPISRLLCDSRILNIFEGAAEIQAQVIARRMLS